MGTTPSPLGCTIPSASVETASRLGANVEIYASVCGQNSDIGDNIPTLRPNKWSRVLAELRGLISLTNFMITLQLTFAPPFSISLFHPPSASPTHIASRHHAFNFVNELTSTRIHCIESSLLPAISHHLKESTNTIQQEIVSSVVETRNLKWVATSSFNHIISCIAMQGASTFFH